MDNIDRDLLIRIDERVASLVVTNAEAKAERYAIKSALTDRLNVHSGRIRKLELWRSWLAGGMAALGFAIMVLLKFIK